MVTSGCSRGTRGREGRKKWLDHIKRRSECDMNMIQTWWGSFSAVTKPIFETKCSLEWRILLLWRMESSWRDWTIRLRSLCTSPIANIHQMFVLYSCEMCRRFNERRIILPFYNTLAAMFSDYAFDEIFSDFHKKYFLENAALQCGILKMLVFPRKP